MREHYILNDLLIEVAAWWTHPSCVAVPPLANSIFSIQETPLFLTISGEEIQIKPPSLISCLQFYPQAGVMWSLGDETHAAPAHGLSHSYSIHSSLRKVLWNHMAWSREAANLALYLEYGSRAVPSRAKSDTYAATQQCSFMLPSPK